MTRDWNAVEYHRVSDPQVSWGRAVLDRLELRGDERVIDLGCGTGRLTRELTARVPHGAVVGIDASRDMLTQAASHLAGTDPPVRLAQALLPAIPVTSWADVVFSTATFHWVRDHPALFTAIHASLVPGGRLHAQCGGGQNLAEARAPAEEVMKLPRYAPYFEGWQGAWEFADDRISAVRLRDAGFVDIQTSLEPAPVDFTDEGAYRAYVSTVVFRLHLAQLPDALRAPFLDDVVARVRDRPQRFRLDYWRLNLRARR